MTEDSGIDALTELALNLRSFWHHGADELWRQLDPELWSLTHNPWAVLQTVSRTKLRDLLARPDYRTRLEAADLFRQLLARAHGRDRLQGRRPGPSEPSAHEARAGRPHLKG